MKAERGIFRTPAIGEHELEPRCTKLAASACRFNDLLDSVADAQSAEHTQP